jgi:cholesterol transport system auxiliary component
MNDNRFAPTRRYWIASAAALFALAGCSRIVGPGAAPQLYILAPQLQPPPDAPAVQWALQIALPEASQSFDTDRIALINPPTRMDYYADAAWPDRLPVLLRGLLVQAFQGSGKIGAVSPDTAALRADYQLMTTILDFSAHYAVPDTAPEIVVSLEAMLVRRHGRTLVARRRIEQSTEADANSVDSVVLAFNRALSEALKQIVDWTLHAAGPEASKP